VNNAHFKMPWNEFVDLTTPPREKVLKCFSYRDGRNANEERIVHKGIFRSTPHPRPLGCPLRKLKKKLRKKDKASPREDSLGPTEERKAKVLSGKNQILLQNPAASGGPGHWERENGRNGNFSRKSGGPEGKKAVLPSENIE